MSAEALPAERPVAADRLTPFMLFFCEYKESVQLQHPASQPHEVSQFISEQWKALTPAQARAYSVLSATYAEQKKSASNSGGGLKKRKERKEKDPKAPKSATSAYMYFSKHHRLLLKQENADLTFGDLGKTVGAMWKAAAPLEKRPFEELAAEDKQRYVSELADYRTIQTHENPTATDDVSAIAHGNADAPQTQQAKVADSRPAAAAGAAAAGAAAAGAAAAGAAAAGAAAAAGQ
ncbi:high mobility group box domain-containing protein [Pelagophyceae sp. CCMP2097]|nr:high mobility group box domain-containing protein [Pelagophyceae sp. CCMP2097]